MYDFKTIEPEILSLWEKNSTHKKAKEKSKDGKPFYFLDGPPYTSGKVHIGTAWNKSLKDMIQRIKRMQGYNVWDRAGYDMHGLPTEHATEKKLNISGKQEIKEFGIAKFIEECKKLCVDNMNIMNEDFKQMGVWMDFDNAYQSIKDEFIDGEWWLIKKAHENNRLYEGERSMSWCASCTTAIAKHELEYKKITDNSIYVKFKVKQKEKSEDKEKQNNNEYIIIWTTTPWTIPFNLACMVHPEFDYVKAKVNDEVWILAKDLANKVITEKAETGFEIIKTLKGKDLEGLEYEGLFENELPQIQEWKKECPKTYTILLSDEYVNVDDGTGVVHCAPGCGPEDYEVGHRNGIKPFNTLNVAGVYTDIPMFEGMKAKTDDKDFIEKIKEKGALIASTPINHDYAHCDRCKNPIVYKTTKQWFFKVEDMKDKMIEENDKINWVPKAAYNAFNSWLQNLRDNSITKQRYWGTPVPIWRNENDPSDYIVIGSKAELEKLSGQTVEDMHIPKIDDITIEKDGNMYKRIPDILDVWVDAGCASWNCLGFPQSTENFEKFFPATFILEGKDQIRGWFNLLHVASMISHNKPSFKACYMHGFVQDAQGRKMSKSLGNYILPSEVIEKYGADTFRLYAIGAAGPALDLNYNFDDMKVKHKNLSVIWNLHTYLLSLAKEMDGNPKDLAIEIEKGSKSKITLENEEQYIISKLHSTIKKATTLTEEFQLNQVPWAVEELFLELSRTYIQLVREKASIGSTEEKQAVLYTIYTVFTQGLTLLAPIAPMITEKMYLNIKEQFGEEQESIHLHQWPEHDDSKINEELEKKFATVKNIIQSALAAREKIQLGLRWPLKEMIVQTDKKEVEQAVSDLKEMLKTQINVKDIHVTKQLEGVEESITPNNRQIGKDFEDVAPKILDQLDEKALKTIRKDGKITIETKEVTTNHINIERVVPEPYKDMDFKQGIVYLNFELTPELESEGFSREISRKVQAARKKAGLEKTDTITLYIQTKVDIGAWHDQLKVKCGASELKISNSTADKQYEHNSSEKVKGKEFVVSFEKV